MYSPRHRGGVEKSLSDEQKKPDSANNRTPRRQKGAKIIMTQIVTQNGIANSNIVFAPEYRRKVFYRRKREPIREI